MAKSGQDSDLRPGPFGGPAMSGLSSGVGILRGNNEKAWSSRGVRKAFAPLSPRRWERRAVQVEDALAHDLVEGFGDLVGDRWCHAQ